MLIYLKAALVTIGMILCALIATILVTYDSHYETKLALDFFLKGDIEKAEEIVAHFSEGPEKELALAYLERAKQNIVQSNAHLAAAENSNLNLEVALNQAFNAYLTYQHFQAKNALEKVSQSDWILFFTSLNEGGKSPSYTSLKPLSPWMKHSFDQIFTPLWVKIHEARQQIELGNTAKARQQLEEMRHNVHGLEAQDFDLAIALSYIKDAEMAAPLAATPYFKLAFGYLKRVPLHAARYHRERQQIAAALNKEYEALVQQNQTADRDFYTASLHTLGAKAKQPQPLHLPETPLDGTAKVPTKE